jgi:hypothetical protein
MRSTDMHRVYLCTVLGRQVRQLEIGNYGCTRAFGEIESVTDMVSVPMSQKNVVDVDLVRLNRRLRVISQKRIDY